MNSSEVTKKQKRKKMKVETRKLVAREKFYQRNFYLFEISYIILVIPILVLAFLSIPILLCVVLTKNFQMWPFILSGVMITFYQILAVKYFFKRFFLNPHEMSFGEYLRFKFDNRRKLRDFEKKPLETWYDNLEDFIDRIRTEEKEQTYRLYSRDFENVNNNS